MPLGNVELLDEVPPEYAPHDQILMVVADHGSEFYAPNPEENGEDDHPLEVYLDEHEIKQMLCAVGRP